jgi:hypothetical protein
VSSSTDKDSSQFYNSVNTGSLGKAVEHAGREKPCCIYDAGKIKIPLGLVKVMFLLCLHNRTGAGI